MAIELPLYGGLVVFVIAKIFPGDLVTVAGIISAGIMTYFLKLKKMELIDFLVKIPLWIHFLGIFIMTCLYVAGRMYVLSMASLSSSANAATMKD
jgi:hypothetical protein